MDLLLGRFADAYIGILSDADLADFEALLEAPEPDVFAWIVGRAPVDARFDTPVLRAITEFHARRHKPD